MKLINNFFEVLESSDSEGGFSRTIRLNPHHIVYSGHFPGNPVTPGVILLQIVHELLEQYLGKNVELISMAQCKFLKIINPEETSRLVVHINLDRTDQLIKIKARGENSMDIYFRLAAVYQLK